MVGPNKAFGPANIPCRVILKEAAHELAPTLADLYLQLILSLRTLPEYWKKAHIYVAPVFIKGNTNSWWDPGICTNTGAGDTVWQNILNLYYSTGSWKLFHTPYWHSVSEGGSVSSSWKWWPVIMSPAHNPLLLQLPILLHSLITAFVLDTAAIHNCSLRYKISCLYLTGRSKWMSRCWIFQRRSMLFIIEGSLGNPGITGRTLDWIGDFLTHQIYSVSLRIAPSFTSVVACPLGGATRDRARSTPVFYLHSWLARVCQ